MDDYQWKAELEAVMGALSGLITELEAISAALRTDFSGIGTEYCADRIDGETASYRLAYSLLVQLSARLPVMMQAQ